MKNKDFLIPFGVCTTLLLMFAFGLFLCSEPANTCNNTRDIQYENYCDSIWYCDRDYYLDVLAETDEYNAYIEEHGEWWNK